MHDLIGIRYLTLLDDILNVPWAWSIPPRKQQLTYPFPKNQIVSPYRDPPDLLD